MKARMRMIALIAAGFFVAGPATLLHAAEHNVRPRAGLVPSAETEIAKDDGRILRVSHGR